MDGAVDAHIRSSAIKYVRVDKINLLNLFDWKIPKKSVNIMVSLQDEERKEAAQALNQEEMLGLFSPSLEPDKVSPSVPLSTIVSPTFRRDSTRRMTGETTSYIQLP